MLSRFALCLLILAAAPMAQAQDLDAPASAPPAPAAEAAPPAPVTEAPSPPSKEIDLLPGAPDPLVDRPREQVFISPSGEPFRAPPGADYPVGAWFAAADADHDGALSAAEFAADHLAFFKRLDKDADGVIDGFEASAYESDIAPEVAVRDTGRRPRQPRSIFGMRKKVTPGISVRQGAALYGLINEPLPIRAADADFDYRVTTAEITAAAGRRFALLDLNHDGRVPMAELPQTPAQARIAEEAKRRPPPPAPGS